MLNTFPTSSFDLTPSIQRALTLDIDLNLASASGKFSNNTPQQRSKTTMQKRAASMRKEDGKIQTSFQKTQTTGLAF